MSDRLTRAWAALEDGGHTVNRVPLNALDDHEIAALAAEAEHRLKVLTEGEAAGWSPDGVTTRRCSQCDETKPVDDFSWRPGWCKGCESARVRAYHEQRATELGPDEYRQQRAEAQQARRQRLRRAT